MNTKKELFGIELNTYLKASKKGKGEILDSLSRQTGMWRESIMRSFKRLQLESVYTPKKKRGRSVFYTPDVIGALKEIWISANSCCGELLHPLIDEYISIFKRDEMWEHSEEATSKLLAMSEATVKRKVNGWQCESGRKGISTTTPSATKERVPIFQGSWHEVNVGFGHLHAHPDCGTEFLNQIEFLDMVCLYHNHLIAQRLCIGAKVLPNGKHKKIYEKKGMTPYQRLCENERVSEEIKTKLKIEHEKLNPKTLHDKLIKIKSDILKANRLAMEAKQIQI